MDKSFINLNIKQQLIEGLIKQNITVPTEIQEKAIPLILENKDVIGQSHTGSGKTLAYLLPIFDKIAPLKRELQALILVPTIELAMQVDKQIKLLSSNSQMTVSSLAIVGQVNIKRQIEKLREKPQIIVGTPGRIYELITLRKINVQTIKTLIIDEGDRLLDKDNINNIKDILKTTLKTRQVLVFTATLNPDTVLQAQEFMNNPEIVRAAKETVSSTIVHTYVIASEQREKIEILRKLLASLKPSKAIVFLNKSELIEVLTEKLRYHHIEALPIFGTATKEDRQLAIEQFRSGKINILVASDLAARGLDVENLTHIINLDLPEDSKEYLHRVGRTGRMGKEGNAITIVTPNEVKFMKKVERDLNITVQEKVIFKGILQDPFRRNKPSDTKRD